MFNYLEGKIASLNPTYVVIDIQGIGYGVNISLNTFSKLGNLQKAKLYTHVSFKIENTNPVSIDIFGFFDETERTLFRHLISVSRIGNSLALLMLSALTPEDLYHAIATEDLRRLESIKGIGNKAAQRIVMELKGKIEKDIVMTDKIPVSNNLYFEEALSGLVMLGFNRNQATKALEKVVQLNNGTALKVEELIKETLKII